MDPKMRILFTPIFSLALVLSCLVVFGQQKQAPPDYRRAMSSNATSGFTQDLGSFTLTTNVPYVTPSDGIRVGDLYLPKDTGKLHPAVLFIHGGGWTSGDKAESTGNARALAQHGFVVFNINYRLINQGGAFPADVIDTKEALAFLALNAKKWQIDTKKMAAMGGSAGAHLSMMLAYTPNGTYAAQRNISSNAHPVAVVSWFGPTSLIGSAHNLVASYIGTGGADSERRASPITYVKTAVPTLFVHGTNDGLVPISQSEDMHKALLSQHIASELLVLPGAGHGFGATDWVTAMNKTIQFLDSQFAKHN